MNIEKKKVENRINLSNITKNAIATSLGIAASATFIACGMDMADQPIPDTEPSSPSTESSDSQQNFSSSSKYLDIPQSHEAISSEVLEALSSVAESVNSSASAPASAADSSASSLANAPSSVVQPHSSATQNLSSSSAVPSSPSSSSFKFGDTLPDYQECPPPFPSTDPCKCVPDGTTVKYQTEFGVQVIMCPQSSNSSWPSHGFSMVTTFERDDIEV